MGMNAVKYKIMPKDLDVNLSDLKEEIREKIESMGGIFSESVEEPIAFGLKALIISFAYPEDKEIDEVGNELRKFDGISSAEMIDFRRAVG